MIAMVVGTLVAALRIAPNKWLQRLGGVYVETFRNIPLLVLLFISFAGLRRAGADRPVDGRASPASASTPPPTSPRRCAPGCSRSARARSRRRSRSASPTAQTLRRIVLPQAFRTVISPLGSLIIAMIKNSAIVGVSLLALDRPAQERARRSQSRTFETNEAFFWAAVGYLLLTVTATLAFRLLERRYAIHR